jgi:hypothetical protein
MRRRNSKRPRTHPIATHTITLNLTLIQTPRSLARRISINDRRRNIVLVDALLGDGVGDDEAALRVAAEGDFRVGAVGEGLLDEGRHDGAAAGAHLRVAGDRGRVVDALDGHAVGSEGFFQGRGEGGADGGAEVLGGLLGSCCWMVDGLGWVIDG